MDHLVRLTFKFIAHPERDSQPGRECFRNFLFLCRVRRLRDHDIRERLLHWRRTAMRNLLATTEQRLAHLFFN
ncbi:hypothetical protein D3C79_991840 [compost metagenome]